VDIVSKGVNTLAEPINKAQEFDFRDSGEGEIDGHKGRWQKAMKHPDLLHAQRIMRFIEPHLIKDHSSDSSITSSLILAEESTTSLNRKLLSS